MPNKSTYHSSTSSQWIDSKYRTCTWPLLQLVLGCQVLERHCTPTRRYKITWRRHATSLPPRGQQISATTTSSTCNTQRGDKAHQVSAGRGLVTTITVVACYSPRQNMERSLSDQDCSCCCTMLFTETHLVCHIPDALVEVQMHHVAVNQTQRLESIR